MKTKLLKEVRKRYSIVRVDEIASNAGDDYKYAKEIYGVPFYELRDTHDAFGFRTCFFDDFNKATAKICEWVVSDYAEKFGRKKVKSSKVWWGGELDKQNKKNKQ